MKRKNFIAIYVAKKVLNIVNYVQMSIYLLRELNIKKDIFEFTHHAYT